MTKAGIDAGGDAPAARLMGAQQEEMTVVITVIDQPLHAIGAVGRLQPLLGEDMEQKIVMLLGKSFRPAFLDGHARFDAPSDGTPARALHAREDLILALGEIGHVAVDHPMGIAESLPLLDRHVAIADFEMYAAKLAKGKMLEGGERLGAGHVRVEVEAHIGRGPAAKRAGQDLEPGAPELNAGEIAERFIAPPELGDDNLALDEAHQKIEPGAALAKEAVIEAVEDVEIDILGRDPLENQGLYRSLGPVHVVDVLGKSLKRSGHAAASAMVWDRMPKRSPSVR